MCRIQRLLKTRRVTLLLGAGILALAAGVWATTLSRSGHEEFFQGNQAYSEGRFRDAIAHYRASARDGGVSAPLFLNMGNAYLRMGSPGQAIVSYERALLLDPGNPDVRANLAKVRSDLGLFEEPVPVWIRAFDSLSVNAWTWLASAAFSLLALLSLIRGLMPFYVRHQGMSKLTSFFSFKVVVPLLVVLMVVAATGVWTQFRNVDRAVVIQPDVRLLVSPFESADSITRIREGRAVEVLREFGEYARVRAHNGQKGWVSRAVMEPIVPRPEVPTVAESPAVLSEGRPRGIVSQTGSS